MLPFLAMGLSDCGHAADGRAAMVAPERAVFRTSRREKLDMCLVPAGPRVDEERFAIVCTNRAGTDSSRFRDQILAHGVAWTARAFRKPLASTNQVSAPLARPF